MQKILVIDSDISTYEFIKTNLKLYNHTIFSALHGAEALEFVEKHSLDCVIVDLNVEHVNGLEIIDLLIKWYTKRPWIIATFQPYEQNADFRWLEIATSLGANEILAKPYSMEQLWHLLPSSLVNSQDQTENEPDYGVQVYRDVLQVNMSP